MSAAPLFTTEKVVRQSSVPDEEALNTPASVTAPVPVPAGKSPTYSTVLVETVCDVSATREAAIAD